MTLTLSPLEVLLLLRCKNQNGLISKPELIQSCGNYNIAEKAIKSLARQNLIMVHELPKLGGRKMPTFYRLAGKGMKWAREYNKEDPKKRTISKGFKSIQEHFLAYSTHPINRTR
jgi:hypothetical protein